MATRTWKTQTGVPIADVVGFGRENACGGQAVHLGTDSIQLGRHTRFVTVVAILTPGRGGRAIWRREVRPPIASLRERLLREVWLSVELGLSLSPVVPGPLSVHIDANAVETHRSSVYVQELVGLVVSQGYRAVIKPESWAASRAADRMVRVADPPPATRPMAPGPAARSPHSVIGGARTAHGF
ncbi:MAG TPA: ribonuclease H-like YkuK family protein [Vicinamibacteria bacterium]|nr:ribonuclease H-like YkuK family protein [Vicinamibacteria bacterium]